MTASLLAAPAKRESASLQREPAEIHARFERSTAALRRTNAIIDRVCPMPFLPNVSSRYPELNGSVEAWRNFNDASSRRKALFREIMPRMKAKVEGRPA